MPSPSRLFAAFRKPQGALVHFDSPLEEFAGPLASFQGWIASEEPIGSVVLEADGRADAVTSFHGRPDVEAQSVGRHVTGWEHALFVGTEEAARRSFTARLVVNGKAGPLRSFTCLPPTAAGAHVAPDVSSEEPGRLYQVAARALGERAVVLEVGTRQASEGVSTHSLKDFPGVSRSNYVMMDVRPGADVDVLGDLHALPADWSARFDAVHAVAVFEHLERPWIAAKEIHRILKPGGFCLIGTHQTYPLHGHPSDFFRFSKEALTLIFADAGVQVESCAYQDRAQIVAPRAVLPPALHDRWNAEWPSYIRVTLFGRKPRAGT